MLRNLIAKDIIILSFTVSVILLTACGRNSMEGMVILTEGRLTMVNPDYITGQGWRNLPQSQLTAIDPSNPSAVADVLTSDFYSASSPDISFDGSKIIFAAQKNQDDPWQIWEMDLRKLSSRQVTKLQDDCVDPVYLPGNKMVFSRQIQNDSLKAGYTLFSCNLDGSELRRLTFNPHTFFASSILKDGRIIAISRQVFPSVSKANYMVLRPDGTKAELFYDCTEGNELVSNCQETVDGKIYFIEREQTAGKSRIVSIDYNRPLHSRKPVSGTDGDYTSVLSMSDGSFLVAGRIGTDKKFVLYTYDMKNGKTGSKLYESADNDIIDALLVKAYERPRKLPSEVDFGVKTGLMLCQNINVTGMNSPETGFSLPLADKIEIIGVDSSLGFVKVESDGSVYLKVAADMPFRIRTLDSKGSVVNGPGGWYYLRPNERRGCIGCHEDSEMVPANRYAVAVSKNPVSVPVHFEGVKEKEVELE
ncbi:MAG: hypothetical protein IPN68_10830 [Bacteroidetes bacterium]|nr:hypothetical protein [Bacteroidota bacterium]